MKQAFIVIGPGSVPAPETSGFVRYEGIKKLAVNDHVLLYYQAWHGDNPFGLVIGYIDEDRELKPGDEFEVDSIELVPDMRRIIAIMEGRLKGPIIFFG